MRDPCYILGITGSPRLGGNTEILMHQIIDGAKSVGAITEIINLRSLTIKRCIACERCRTARVCRAHNDDMQIIYPKIKAAKGLILGSPTHSFNVSAKMKTFIDRLYPFYHYSVDSREEYCSLIPVGKKSVIYAVAELQTKEKKNLTLDAMRLPLENLGIKVTNEFIAYTNYQKESILNNKEILEQAFLAGVSLAKTIIEDN